VISKADYDEAVYNSRDALSMCRVYPHLVTALERRGTLDVYAVDEQMADLALQMTRIGLPVNSQMRQEIGDRLKALRTEAIEVLRPYTEGDFRESFVEWVAAFFAAKARKGEPVAGSLRVGLTRAQAEMDELLVTQKAWKEHKKANAGDAELVAGCEAPLANIADLLKTAKLVVKAAAFETDEFDGLVHTAESAFEIRKAIRRADCLLALEKKGVNFGAKVQQCAILRAAGVPLIKTTGKSGLPKVDKEVLESLRRHPSAKALLKYILVNSTINVYIEGEKRAGKSGGKSKPVMVTSDGYIHPNWSIHKITGRWGSSPNCFERKTRLRCRLVGEDGEGDFLRVDELYRKHKEGFLFEVAQFNPESGCVEYVVPSSIFRRFYQGPMYHWTHDLLDLCVTEDHRLMLFDYYEKESERSDLGYSKAVLHSVVDRTAAELWSSRGASNNTELQLSMLAFPFWNAVQVPVVDLGVERFDYQGWVYCLSVPSSYVLTWRNGKICVAGQCQNWSKRAGGGAENLRAMIEAPEGYTFIGADQAQLEARLIGAMSQCPYLLGIFQRGEDIHSAMAEIGFPLIWPKLAATYKEHKKAMPKGKKCQCADCAERDKMRDIVKHLEYGGFYGGKDQTLWEDVVSFFPDFTQRQTREFLVAFNQRLPEVLAWRQQTLNEAINEGVIRSPILGRCQVFPLGRVDPTVAYNYKAQSGGADLWALGAIEFMKCWDQFDSVDARLIHNGHDSVLVLVRNELAKQVEADVYSCWSREWNGVPFIMETKIANRWSET
jgi:DNA polymerase I-like protein with 3'-5' exonuclease and polymerase domains